MIINNHRIASVITIAVVILIITGIISYSRLEAPIFFVRKGLVLYPVLPVRDGQGHWAFFDSTRNVVMLICTDDTRQDKSPLSTSTRNHATFVVDNTIISRVDVLPNSVYVIDCRGRIVRVQAKDGFATRMMKEMYAYYNYTESPLALPEWVSLHTEDDELCTILSRLRLH